MTIQYFLIAYNTHKDHVLLLKPSRKLPQNTEGQAPSDPCTLAVIDLLHGQYASFKHRVANVVFARYGRGRIDITIQDEPLTMQQTS
jgi:hypothetical protein